MTYDYFTVSEYRAQMNDRSNVGSQTILDAQEEVIDYLERWAHTAWPTVGVGRTGSLALGGDTLALTAGTIPDSALGTNITVVGAGADGADLYSTIATWTDETHVTLADVALTAVTDAGVRIDTEGEAYRVRRATEQHEVLKDKVLVNNAPVTSVLSSDYTLGSTMFLREDAGIICNVGLTKGTLLTVTYEFGYAYTPRAVKRACIEATATLVRSNGGGRIPANTKEYTTEGTTITLESIAMDEYPWPWDSSASRSLRVYWESRRPRQLISV